MEGVQLSHPPRISQPFGWGAGLVALGGIIAALVGGVWGLTRPGYSATVDDGGARIDPALNADNVEFISFVGFVLLTTLLGLLIGVVAFLTAGKRAGIGRMLFTIAVAAFSSWTLFILGTWSAELYHGVPDPHDVAPGQTLTFVPVLRPGPAWLAGPFVAALAYWLGAVSSVGSGPAPRDAEYDERHAQCD